MSKKLFLPILLAVLAVLTSCSSKMGALSSDNFTCTPQILESVAGTVPATINGRFPAKYFNKKATVQVTPVLRWNGGQAVGQGMTFQGEKVLGNGRTVNYKNGGTFTMLCDKNGKPQLWQGNLYE